MIASLWIGRDLSAIEVMSIRSYLNFGNEFYLFTYDNVGNVPDGVTILDANDVINYKKIFKYQNSYASFSDYFRYKMIKKYGFVWTDLDSICLKKIDIDSNYIFGINDANNMEEYVATSFLSLPQDSEILDSIIFDSEQIISQHNYKWGPMGPTLLTKKVFEFSLEEMVLPAKYFAPIHFSNWKYLWEKEMFKTVYQASKDSYTIQIWNEMVNRSGIDRNHFPTGSYINFLYKKIMI